MAPSDGDDQLVLISIVWTGDAQDAACNSLSGREEAVAADEKGGAVWS